MGLEQFGQYLFDSFDMAFFERAFRAANLPFAHPKLDTLTLVRNVYPVMTESVYDWDQLLDEATQAAVREGFITGGDRIVISAGLPLNVSGNTNTIKVETVTTGAQ